MKKRLLSLLLAVSLMAGMLSTTAYADTMPFTDLEDGAWYMSAVQYAYDNGIMNGKSTTTFAPDANLTRAEACQILYNYEGQPGYTGNAFTDASSDAWFYAAVSWAADNEIVNGMTEDTFEPDADITREQMVTILYRYAIYKGYDVTETDNLSGYTDASSVGSWALTAMQWAVGSGCVGGMNETTLGPQGTATRAQMATIMMRLEEYLSAVSYEKVLVAEELSSESTSKPVSDVMDLLYYAQQEMTFGEESTGGKSIVRSFKGDASDYDVLCAYVELLCDEYNFELAADPYYNDSGNTYTFIEFVLNYTGSKSLIANGITGTYTQNTGDVMIYAYVKRDRLEGAIWIDSALEISDDGYVYGSDSGGSNYIGDSFAAGLYRLKNGSFQTTDGRLTAAVGEAMVITDGTSATFNSVYIYDNDENRQEIYIENKYGTEQQVIYIPTTVTLASNLIFDSSYFIIDSDSQTNQRGVSTNVPAFTWTAMYACLHDGSYIIPVRGLSGVMTDVNVRVMYVDESIAVFYTCAQFESEPYEIESLIAVGIGTDTVLENQPDGEYTIYVGESIEITGPRESNAGHSLWTWEYLEGSQFSELTGTTSQICTLTGNRVGDVRVKVTYDYSVQEPDVLTGISKTVQKVQEQEFVIHIVNK